MLSEVEGIPSTAGVPQISGRNNFHHHNIGSIITFTGVMGVTVLSDAGVGDLRGVGS
jgi:hypothetical protein